MSELSAVTTIIGGGVVGAAVAFTLAHRGVDTLLLEAEPELALAASGTNSGCLHSGFDSTPGELETRLILRTAELRTAVLEALGIPVIRCGAELVPHKADDHDVIAGLARNAASNGVEAHIRDTDGALVVPGEWITDPVAFTLGLAASARAAGARVETQARVTGIGDDGAGGLLVELADGRRVRTEYVINCAGLGGDAVAAMAGDHSFEIFPRKGEFFVFRLPEGERLEHILLPVPTKRTKGVLVFPTIDGGVVAGPTAHDQLDKTDWTVRPEARDEILEKAYAQFPLLRELEPVAEYAGLRPAGRGSNYVIGVSEACERLVNVAAIRSTGLSASLGIGEYVADLLATLGVRQAAQAAPVPGAASSATRSSATGTSDGEWWRRTAHFRDGLAEARA